MKTDMCTFVKVRRWILLTVRNVLDKICAENQNTFCVRLTFFQRQAIYEIMWKNTVQPNRTHMTI